MLFKYTINFELEVEFDAPLLGVDTTIIKRKITDTIALNTLEEVLMDKNNSMKVKKIINEDNLIGSINCSKKCRKGLV
jgi:hypothetical protein